MKSLRNYGGVLSVLELGLGLVGLLSSEIAGADSGGLIKITCGGFETGAGVEFEISPLKSQVRYTSYQDGKEVSSELFSGGNGLSGLDTGNTLSFASSNGFDPQIEIHGDFSKIYRINHFSAITIHLEKQWNEAIYLLTRFSEGHLTTSSFDEKVMEVPHPEFVGLPCAI